MELTLQIHRRTRVRIALLASTAPKPVLTRKTTAPRVGRASTTLMRDLTTPMTAVIVRRASTSAPLATPPSRTVPIAKLAHTAQVMAAILALTALRASIRQQSVLRQRTRAHSVRKGNTTRQIPTPWALLMGIVRTAPSARSAATLAPKMTVPAQAARQESTALRKELAVPTSAQIAAPANITSTLAAPRPTLALNVTRASIRLQPVLRRRARAQAATQESTALRKELLAVPTAAQIAARASTTPTLAATRPMLASNAPLAHILAMVLHPAAPAPATP